jgi:hypothetical protein
MIAELSPSIYCFFHGGSPRPPTIAYRWPGWPLLHPLSTSPTSSPTSQGCSTTAPPPTSWASRSAASLSGSTSFAPSPHLLPHQFFCCFFHGGRTSGILAPRVCLPPKVRQKASTQRLIVQKRAPYSVFSQGCITPIILDFSFNQYLMLCLIVR